MFESVLMVWDLYDGPRSGLAKVSGKPHYFKCTQDWSKDNASDLFQLHLVSDELLAIANEQWAIYRQWEYSFHSGHVSLSTHPGHGGNDLRYDQLESEIKSHIARLEPLPDLYIVEFRAREQQANLPAGCLRELEAKWEAT